MREILFRGKAINRDVGYHNTNYRNGDWVYGLITRLFDKRFENVPAEMKNTDGVSGIEIDFKTVGQYTGLTDKNGKKIFEGDIVIDKFDNEKYGFVGVVTYIPERTQFEVVSKEYPNYIVNLGSRASGANSIRIIGNIFDNPELPKGE